jgi:hypothetical protein
LCCGAGAMLSVAACGSSNSSGYASHAPGSILSDALKATSTATAFDLSGTLHDGGSSLGVNLGYKASPSSLSAQITEGSNLIKIIVVPAGSYIYANTAFWKKEAASLPASELSQLANHWFKTTSAMSSSFTSAFKQLTPAKIAGCLSHTFTKPAVTGTQTINGQSVVALRSAGGSSGKNPATLYVATSAPHYLMRLTQANGSSSSCDGGSGSSEKGSLTFSQWNQVSISAPPGAKPLP